MSSFLLKPADSESNHNSNLRHSLAFHRFWKAGERFARRISD